MIDLDTWLISDTHFGHQNIVKFCGRPEDHEFLMAVRWYNNVKPEDTILHLGDITYRGDKGAMQAALRSLPGNKLRIPGNHDKQKPSYYAEAGFTDISDHLGLWVECGETPDGMYYENTVDHYGYYAEFESQRVLFSHYPDVWMLDWDVNVHGHIHNNPYYARTAQVIEDNPDKRWINVSVEVIDYTPVKLKDLLCPA